MTYNPNIPFGAQNISQGQVTIQTNFSQLETIFDNDHYTWDNATVANRGRHRQITIPAYIADPNPTNPSSVLYTKDAGGGFTGLYFQNDSTAADVYPLLTELLGPGGGPGTNFGTKIGPLIFNYGTGTCTGGTATVTFAIPFTSGSSYGISLLPTSGTALTEGQWCFSPAAGTATIRRGDGETGSLGFQYLAIGN